jgi:hypothetical protein
VAFITAHHLPVDLKRRSVMLELSQAEKINFCEILSLFSELLEKR